MSRWLLEVVGVVVQQEGGEEQQAGVVLVHQVLGESRHLGVVGVVVQKEGAEEQQVGVVLVHQVLGESRHLAGVWQPHMQWRGNTVLGYHTVETDRF